MECFKQFYDVSDAIDLNLKYDWFKMKVWSKQVSLNNQAKRQKNIHLPITKNCLKPKLLFGKTSWKKGRRSLPNTLFTLFR